VIVGEVGASRPDFQASEDDNVLVQGIIGDRQALGFFGYTYLDHNRDKLGVIGIDGGAGCVVPTVQTIRNGSYFPLSRPLFIYVKLSSLGKPGFRDFLVFFMTHAEELIPETGLLPVSQQQYRENLDLLAAAAGLSISQVGGSQWGDWPGG
jgi:phosphate transport system substrate-binding protein